jgi:hypothetical protein
MSISNIKSKLTQAISIKSDMLAAFSSRGLSVTSNTPFAQFPSLIMDIHDTVQAKEAFPRAEGVVVTPDSGYTALTQVTIPSEPNLAADNIVAGKSIYGVQGVAVVENPVVVFIENRYFDLNDPDGDIHTIQALSSNSYLTTVNLPGVSTIPSYIFSGCTALETALLPAVTKIPDMAFHNCYMLKTASFGSTSISVGMSAFYYCYGFDPGFMVSRLTAVGTAAFAKTRLSIFIPLYPSEIPAYLYWGTQIQEIPSEYQSTIRLIRQSAFAETPISEVSLPNVSLIENWAFGSCSTLRTVSLPNCTTIYPYAFSQCSRLREVFVSNTISIGASAFAMCSQLSTVYLGCPVEASSPTLSMGAFSGCSNLQSVIFEGPWKFTSQNVFYGCGSLYYLHLRHSSVMSLNQSAMFYNCPIGARNSSAHIYVPASLVSNYQVANQWSYFASLFTAEE